MLKVMTIVGTRPELIKMCRVISLFDEHTEHVLVHTGQNFDFELSQVFFDELNIRKPDYFLGAAGATPIETISQVLTKVDAVLDEVKPDAVLLYGDTNSCLAVMPAKRRRIPVFHMEAGNRCFDQRVPEELNRKVIDHLSDINMTLTEHARRYLLDEGLSPDRVMVVGSHMEEVLDHFSDKIAGSNVLTQMELSAGGYFIVSAHREENVDSPRNLRNFLDLLNGLVETFGYPVIVSTHPRTRKKLETMTDVNISPSVSFMKPFGFFDYLTLQKNAACVLSDSGTITEESSLMGFPAVTIREAHERPEGMDKGTLIMSGLTREHAIDCVKVAMALFKTERPEIVPDYKGGRVSAKVLKIVMSYVDFIRKNVWREPAK